MSQTYTVTVDPFGAEIPCRSDQTIPHRCAHGTCGTCKAEVVDGEVVDGEVVDGEVVDGEVVDGEVDHGDACGFALMDFEREDGKTLLCTARPRGGVVVEADVDADDDTPSHAVDDYSGTVVAVEDIPVDTRRLRRLRLAAAVVDAG